MKLLSFHLLMQQQLHCVFANTQRNCCCIIAYLLNVAESLLLGCCCVIPPQASGHQANDQQNIQRLSFDQSHIEFWVRRGSLWPLEMASLRCLGC